jgi:hypothetical protein
MKLHLFALPFLFAATAFSAWSGPTAPLPRPASLQAGAKAPATPVASGVQVASGEEVQRQEALSGRRLTPTELAELRQQVRQQWAGGPEVVQASQVPAGERIMPGAATKGVALQPTANPRP